MIDLHPLHGTKSSQGTKIAGFQRSGAYKIAELKIYLKSGWTGGGLAIFN